MVTSPGQDVRMVRHTWRGCENGETSPGGGNVRMVRHHLDRM